MSRVRHAAELPRRLNAERHAQACERAANRIVELPAAAQRRFILLLEDVSVRAAAVKRLFTTLATDDDPTEFERVAHLISAVGERLYDRGKLEAANALQAELITALARAFPPNAPPSCRKALLQQVNALGNPAPFLERLLPSIENGYAGAVDVSRTADGPRPLHISYTQQLRLHGEREVDILKATFADQTTQQRLLRQRSLVQRQPRGDERIAIISALALQLRPDTSPAEFLATVRLLQTLKKPAAAYDSDFNEAYVDAEQADVIRMLTHRLPSRDPGLCLTALADANASIANPFSRDDITRDIAEAEKRLRAAEERRVPI